MNNVTVSELSRRANVDRKTFYLHYASIANLAEEILTAKVQRVIMGVTLRAATGELNVANMVVEELNRVFMDDLAFYQGIVRFMPVEVFVERAWPSAYQAMRLIACNYAGDEKEFCVSLRFSLAGFVAAYKHFLLSDNVDFETFTPEVERIVNHVLLAFGVDPHMIAIDSIGATLGNK